MCAESCCTASRGCAGFSVADRDVVRARRSFRVGNIVRRVVDDLFVVGPAQPVGGFRNRRVRRLALKMRDPVVCHHKPPLSARFDNVCVNYRTYREMPFKPDADKKASISLDFPQPLNDIAADGEGRKRDIGVLCRELGAFNELIAR